MSIFQIGFRLVKRRLTNALSVSIRLQPVYGQKLSGGWLIGQELVNELEISVDATKRLP